MTVDDFRCFLIVQQEAVVQEAVIAEAWQSQGERDLVLKSEKKKKKLEPRGALYQHICLLLWIQNKDYGKRVSQRNQCTADAMTVERRPRERLGLFIPMFRVHWWANNDIDNSAHNDNKTDAGDDDKNEDVVDDDDGDDDDDDDDDDYDGGGGVHDDSDGGVHDDDNDLMMTMSTQWWGENDDDADYDSENNATWRVILTATVVRSGNAFGPNAPWFVLVGMFGR